MSDYPENVCSDDLKPKLDPVRNLICCVCGDSTRGRQWWNRDTGFGCCPTCVAWVTSRGEDTENLFGVAGVHHSIEEGE